MTDENNESVAGNLLRQEIKLLFMGNNGKWLAFLFMFINGGLLGVHRLVVKKYITGGIMLLGSLLVFTYYFVSPEQGTETYRVMLYLALGGGAVTLGFFLVDMWLILSGNYTTKSGNTYERKVPGELMMALVILMVFNLQLLVIAARFIVS